MYCKTCGAELVNGSDVCVVCGTENTATEPTQPVQPVQPTFVPHTQPAQPTQPVPLVQPTYTQPLQQPTIPKIISIQGPVTPHNGYVSFWEAVKLFFTNYFNFNGRASKSEFWWTQLFLMLAGFATSMAIVSFVIFLLATGEGEEVFLFALIAIFAFLLSLYIPTISLQIRRLHDMGKPWFCILLGMIPYAGVFILLFLFLKDSDGDNAWGIGPTSNRRL